MTGFVDFLVYLLTIAGIWAMLSLSLNVQFGLAGLVDLGHVAFFMLGAYVSTILVVLNGWDITFGILAGGLQVANFLIHRRREVHDHLVGIAVELVLRLLRHGERTR